MLRVDSVESLPGCAPLLRTPVFGIQFPVPDFRAHFRPGSVAVLAVFAPIFGYTRMHNFATAYSRRCEFAHLGSGGVRPLYEARVWFRF